MNNRIRIATVVGATLAVTAALPSGAADEVTLQLKWVTQGQFAGYYVAEEKSFYDELDLDVTIKPGGPHTAPPQVTPGAAPTSSSTGCPRPSPAARGACRWSTSPSRSSARS